MKRYDPRSESGKPEKERQSANAKGIPSGPTNPLTLKEAYRKLSARESQVLDLLVVQKTNNEIAEELFLSTDTVVNHITRIGAKLGLKGRGKVRKWAQNQFDKR